MEDRAVLLQQGLDRATIDGLEPARDGPSGEERFTELVRRHAGADDTVVDFGTGDGAWLLEHVSPLVRRAIGFDYSARRLWLAEERRRELAASTTSFLLADGRAVPLCDGTATVLINRRGPWTHDEGFMREGVRLLRPGGIALEISIGERNACELDETFGERWQMSAAYHGGERRVDALTAQYRRFGLDVLDAESFTCKEAFPSRQALEYRLLTSPTVEAFSPETDAARLDRLIAGHGLMLTVHRVCLVARKHG